MVLYLHSLVVVGPSVSENLSLLVELPLEVIAKVVESLLELILESVESIVDVSHCFDGLLFVLLNFTRIDKYGEYGKEGVLTCRCW